MRGYIDITVHDVHDPNDNFVGVGRHGLQTPLNTVILAEITLMIQFFADRTAQHA